ncbi:putative membrane-anchored protein [Angulomicrobium amanitiforme]|uniref:Membrane-anchored protein n=2 Tax=Ancylobacter amanitiformis TaxID=217069 RepID=A0ABU0LQS2_9HYPH|nr:putative membrane-anchored protein [Ancylobacter amanitiformis]
MTSTILAKGEPMLPRAGAFYDHPLRATVLAELHARPFVPVATPARILHAAFLVDRSQAGADRAAFAALCTARGQPAPAREAKQHRVSFGGAVVRWERHAEFTTYTWELPAQDLVDGGLPFHPSSGSLAEMLAQVPQPGPLLVAVDVHLATDTADALALDRLFDRASLARSDVEDGFAEIATDFQPDPSGFVRILVRDRGMTADAAGALVQRLLEIETYRTLALLGLPEAQRLAPTVASSEQQLSALTSEMRESEGLAANNKLLGALTSLAAALEADAAASLFRFGATRAYEEIVSARLRAIGERPISGYPTWQQFLLRRLQPAMRTCQAIEQRQANLSVKLTSAANLLRTRVDVELEQQNRDLLHSMNKRARQQLRLQQTVEGLSVAAISYYVVSLIHYLLEGIHARAEAAGLHYDVGTATAMSVPLVALLIWLVVRRIRRGHVDEN